MGQITRTTNPTGLKHIEKKHYVVRVNDSGAAGRVFWIDSFDYAATKLDPSVQLGCIAHAGSTEEYFVLGPISSVVTTPFSLRSLATDKPLKFRFIFNQPDDTLLVAYTDGVRALDEAGNLGSSLVDIEPTDLHGIAWKLTLPQGTGTGDKPNVQVERMLFPVAVSAANHPWFGVLVMPEVMRQIAMAIARNPAALEDSESWIAPWAEFLSALNVDPPTGIEDDDFTAQEDWAEDVVRRFAAKGVFKHHMSATLKQIDDEQP